MLNKRGRINAALALVALVSVCLACASLKNFGKNPVADAHNLMDQANADIDEVNKLEAASEQKFSDLNKAMREGNVDETKRIINDLINDIDKGSEKGKDAADKAEQASKLDLKQIFKDYLLLKVQAYRKYIDAYQAYREAAIAVRDNYTAQGLPADKRTLYSDKYNEYRKLRDEARAIERKASDLYRANPDMDK